MRAAGRDEGGEQVPAAQADDEAGAEVGDLTGMKATLILSIGFCKTYHFLVKPNQNFLSWLFINTVVLFDKNPAHTVNIVLYSTIGIEEIRIQTSSSSVSVTPSRQGKSVTVSRYLLTLTLFGNMGFTKSVTVRGLSL